MKKLTALIVLMLSWLWLMAAITDVQLSIGTTSTLIGSEVTVPIVCTSLTGNGVISYELDVHYDTTRLSFLAPVKTGTLSANGMVSVNEVNGVLHIAAIFTNALSGQGTLLGLKFYAVYHGTAELGFNSAMLNTTAITQLTDGVVNIENQPVDAGISVANYIQQAGTEATIGVYATEVALMNCTSFQFKLGYNPAVLSIAGVSNTACISEGWQLSNRSGTGLLEVAGIGTSPLAEDGALVYIAVQILPTATEFSSLTLTDALFNTIPPTTLSPGRMDVFNLSDLLIQDEPDLQHIGSNNPLFIWSAINTGSEPTECMFQAGTDADWTEAELFDSGWLSAYTQQQLNGLVPDTDIFARVRLKCGINQTDWLEISGHLIPKLLPAELIYPINNQLHIPIQPILSWQAGVGTPPLGYKLSLGTNNPPTNITDELDIGMFATWQPPAPLAYNTQYFWQITPYNSDGDAADCPVWSFTTHDANAIVQFPYLRNFTDGAVVSAGWSVSTTGTTTGGWRLNTTYGVGGGKCLTAGRVPNTSWYLSPVVLVPSSGAEFSFAIRDFSAAGTYDIVGENMAVMVSTTGNAMGDFTDTLLTLDNFAVSTAYATFTCDLTPYAGQAIFLALKRVCNNGNYIFVDNLLFETFTPALSLSANQIVFPVTRLGESRTASISIQNTGDGMLSGTVTYPEGLSGISSFSANTLSLDVSFNPTTGGAYNDLIQINTNGGNSTIEIQANAGAETNECNSFDPEGFRFLPSRSAWELSTATKHSGSAAWKALAPNAMITSPWIAAGSFEGFGFWAKTVSTGTIGVYINSTGFNEQDSYTSHAVFLLNQDWAYHYIPLGTFGNASISFALKADPGVLIDDIDLGAFLVPDTPEAHFLQDSGAISLEWFSAYNCSSYKVLHSTDLLSWQIVSPTEYYDTLWALPEVGTANFYKVIGINGAP